MYLKVSTHNLHIFFGRLLPLLLILVCLANVSCGSDDDDPVAPTPFTPVHHRKTVIVYMVAENSLASFASSDLAELVQGASSIPSDCNVVVYLDDASAPKVYEINAQQGKVTHQGKTERSSSDPDIFQKTLAELCDSFPADHYGLVMWSHGSGWIPAVKAPRKTIGVDNNQNSSSVNYGTELEIPDMRTSLEKLGKHLDFIFFDACFMQCVESSYELRGVCDYVVASPAEIPGPGAPYKAMIPGFFNENVEEGVKSIVESYYQDYVNDEDYGVVISAVKTSQMDSLLSITRQLIPDYYSSAYSLPTEGIQTYCPFLARTYWKPEYHDMASTLNQMLDTESYEKWREQMDSTVFYRRSTTWWRSDYITTYPPRLYITDADHLSLMSIFIPNTKYDAVSSYNTAICKTQWYQDFTK